MRRALPVPDRLLLPPAPTGAAGARWADLPFDTRRRIATRLDRDGVVDGGVVDGGAATPRRGTVDDPTVDDPTVDEPTGYDDSGEADLVAALARRRLDTMWRLRVGSVVLGWLVLMTVWGYGRASTGETVSTWLWLGLGGAVVAAGLHARATSRRARRWRRLADGPEAGHPRT